MHTKTRRNRHLSGLLLTTLLSPLATGQECELDELLPTAAARRFGAQVAAWQDTLMVSGPDDPGGSTAGRVLVYERSGTSWSFVQRIFRPVGGLRFGSGLDLEGDLAVFGADAANGSTGAVYVYERTGGTWQLTQTVTASDGVPGDQFGAAVSLFGDRLAVGAPGDAASGTDAGSVYVYERSSGSFGNEVELFAADGASDDLFGTAVDLGGDALLVGAPGDDDFGADTGAAYVFEFTGAPQAWAPIDKLLASDAEAGARFGSAVTISERLNSVWLSWIGAPSANGAGPASGTIYQFIGFVGGGPGNWAQPLTVLGANDATGFGTSLSMTREARRLAVGVPGTTFGGEVHVLEPFGNPWLTTATLTPTDSSSTADLFGQSVGVFGDVVIGGAPFDEDMASNAGSAYVFAVSYQPNNAEFGDDCDGNGVADLCDAASGNCPDANANGIPDPCETTGPYCQRAPNSTGASGALSRVGSLSVAADDLRLVAENVPAGNTGLFFYGEAALQQPFGDGFRCVGGATFRLFPLTTISLGDVAFKDIDIAAPPQPGGAITPGSTWHFQFWFRDPMGPGGSGFNLSDSLGATFCP